MLKPDNQKIYFTTDDLSKVYPDSTDAELTAMDVIEAENSYIIVDGEQIAIGYDEAKDVVLVLVSNESDDTLAKARKLLELFVANDLYDTHEIENENGAMPDEDYPMSVNVADKGSYGAKSYYPSYEQMANAKVTMGSGTAYPYVFYVNVSNGANNPEGAIEEAVVMAEKIAPGALHDVAEVEDEMATEGHYDRESGEKDAVFEETYMYVDATMSGAKTPYYILVEDLGVLSNKGVLA